MGTPQESEETRRRLIEAAGEVFAEEGFHGATVRAIAARAETNLAAINYHFGDKEGLYQAVLGHACCNAGSNRGGGELSRDVPAEGRLAMLIRGAVEEMLRTRNHPWIPKLMQREKAAPTAIYLQYMEREILPVCQNTLPGIVAELTGLSAEHPSVRLLVFSMVGQVNFYRMEGRLIDRLHPDFFADPKLADRLAEHLTRTCLAMMRAFDVRPVKPRPALGDVTLAR
jgi:TetR/AcrR family transcriptional regulator, regulator of cefoperazone and chloramphenicol sensitivity